MPKSPELSPKKRAMLIIATGVLILFIPCLLAEVTTRLLSSEYYTPETLRKQALQYAPSIFSRHVFPNIEQTVTLPDGRRFYINSLGYRGGPFSIRKAEGVIRIVFLGGSAVFDPQVSEGHDWPHVVEALLRERGYNVESINAGTPGHRTSDSLGRLYAEIHWFQPDYVVVYQAWNDIDSFRSLVPENSLLRQLKPFKENADPRLNYTSFLDRLLSFSQFYVKVRNRYYTFKLRAGAEGKIPEGEYVSDFSPYAIQQYKLHLQLIVDTCRNIDAVPLLFTQGRLVAPYNTSEDRSRIGYHWVLLTHEALVRAFKATDDAIKEVARGKHVDFLDLSARFTGRSELFVDHIHLSRKGSEEIAGVVADFMTTLLNKRKED